MGMGFPNTSKLARPPYGDGRGLTSEVMKTKWISYFQIMKLCCEVFMINSCKWEMFSYIKENECENFVDCGAYYL